LKSLGTFLLLVVLAAALAGYLLLAPFGPSAETFVDIPAGASTAQIAAQLQQAGIIRSRLSFEVLRFAAHLLKGGTLHPGEYRFDRPLALAKVYTRLAHGDIYTIALVIPEGFNLFDIARALQTARLGDPADFLAAARQHTELVAEWAPHAASVEGYLFPATYRFPRRATPLQMMTAMTRRFRQAALQLGLSGNVAETVVMASLIEKEVSQDAERPIVAGVFLNRLAKSMPLQTDPAVVYAALLEGRYRGTIYRSDLDSPSLYNTYKHVGLPPGPICNPGMAAFRAALHPTASDLLYFVSDGAGHTRFSATLEEHEQQVNDYRAATRHP
jgi:UPF0755 protein